MGKKKQKQKQQLTEDSELQKALELTEEQKKELEEYKELVRREFEEKTFDDAMLIKFLRARKWDKHRAIDVLKNYHRWYDEVGSITIEDVRHVLEKDIILFPGTRDKDGYFILYMRPGLYFPSNLPSVELVTAVVYLLERIIEEEHVQVNGFTFIADMRNWGWQNFEVNYARSFMYTMENRFPARLRKFILIDPPSWFNLVWVIIRPMFSAKFASKWHFLSTSTISNQVDADNMFHDVNGNFKFAMEEWIKERYEIENIPYSDEYLTKKSKKDKIFAEKATKT